MKFFVEIFLSDPSHVYVRTYMLIAKACVFTFGWVWVYINSAYNAKMPVEMQTQLSTSSGKIALS